MTSRTPNHLLDQIVAVQRVTITTDASGSPVRTWSTHLAQLRAAVQFYESSYRLFVPVDADIAEADRVLWEGHTLVVSRVQKSNKAVGVQSILAKEVQP